MVLKWKCLNTYFDQLYNYEGEILRILTTLLLCLLFVSVIAGCSNDSVVNNDRNEQNSQDQIDDSVNDAAPAKNNEIPQPPALPED